MTTLFTLMRGLGRGRNILATSMRGPHTSCRHMSIFQSPRWDSTASSFTVTLLPYVKGQPIRQAFYEPQRYMRESVRKRMEAEVSDGSSAMPQSFTVPMAPHTPEKSYASDTNPTPSEELRSQLTLRAIRQELPLFRHLPDVVRAMESADTENEHAPSSSYTNRGAYDVQSHTEAQLLKAAGVEWAWGHNVRQSDRDIKPWDKWPGTNLLIAYPADHPDNVLASAPELDTNAVPLILLDVDGVINALGDRWGKVPPLDGYTRSRCYFFQRNMMTDFTRAWTREEDDFGYGSSMYWSGEVVARINAWSDRAEVQWLTTWQHEARTSISPALGLRSFKTAEFWKDDTPTYLEEKKQQHRPVVWLDDELLHDWDHYKNKPRDDPKKATYYRQVNKMKEGWGNRFLPIGTGFHRRLTPEDLDRVDAFLDENCGSAQLQK